MKSLKAEILQQPKRLGILEEQLKDERMNSEQIFHEGLEYAQELLRCQKECQENEQIYKALHDTLKMEGKELKENKNGHKRSNNNNKNARTTNNETNVNESAIVESIP